MRCEKVSRFIALALTFSEKMATQKMKEFNVSRFIELALTLGNISALRKSQ